MHWAAFQQPSNFLIPIPIPKTIMRLRITDYIIDNFDV